MIIKPKKSTDFLALFALLPRWAPLAPPPRPARSPAGERPGGSWGSSRGRLGAEPPQGRPPDHGVRPLDRMARRLDPKGRPLVPHGRPLDPKARPLDPKAQLLNPKGRPLDAKGPASGSQGAAFVSQEAWGE